MADPYTVPRRWVGATAVIVAGGPSLDLEQIHRLAIARGERRCRVICVNDAVFPCWWADWLHAGDGKWWVHYRNAGVLKFPGTRTTTTETVLPAWGVGFLRVTGMDGFDPDPACVRGGNSSTYVALHIAVHAGAARVVLLGVDMKPRDGRHHWFGDHWDGTTTDYLATMAPHFETLKPALKERGVEVLNCSPGTALEAFPTARLDEVL